MLCRLVLVSGLLAVVACNPGGEPAGDAPGDDDVTEPPVIDPDDDDDDEPDDEPEAGESWTFLVYMAADNNLEWAAVEDLREMIRVGSTDDVEIVVLADRLPGYSPEDVGGLPDWTSAKLLHVRDGALHELDDWGEVNMGSKAVLSRFIEEGLDAYPADRTALVFWNHGGAWLGFGWDDTNAHDPLTLDEIDDGLGDGLAATTETRFDLIGFDACLMAAWEVAEAVEAHGRYLLASEELEPGHGWDYEALDALVADPTLNGAALGKVLLDGFVAQAAAQGNARSVTLSVVDLDGIGEVRSAVDDLRGAMTADLPAYLDAIIAARQATPDYASNPDPAQAYHTVDLATFAEALAQLEPALDTKATAVADAVDEVVLHNHFGTDQKGSQGLAIYFPPQVETYNEDYEAIAGMEAWRTFLDAFWGVGLADTGGPTFTDPDGYADLTFLGSEVLVEGHLDAATTADLYEVTFNFALESEDFLQEWELGWVPADFLGGTVSYQWDFRAARLSQGTSESWAYYQIDPTADPDEWVLSIPLAYLASGSTAFQWAQWELVFDGSTGVILTETVYLYTSTGVAQLYAEPASVLYPLVYHWDFADTDNTGWVYLDTPFDATAPLGLSFEELPLDADLGVYLFAEDIAGNVDSVWNVIEGVP